MVRHTTLTTVALTTLLFMAGCTSGLSPSGVSASPNEETEPGQSITVSATGSAETTPDQVLVRVAVVQTGDDVTTVRERLAENTTQVRDALGAAGIDDDQIRTVDYDIDRDHPRPPRPYPEPEERPEPEPEERPEPEPEEPPYRGLHGLEIALTNVSRTDGVIEVAVANGATEIRNVRITLSESERRDLREQALESAMDSARSQADTLAANGNLSIVGVHAIETSEGPPIRRHEADVPPEALEPPTRIETGPVTVQAQVRVIYNATSV